MEAKTLQMITDELYKYGKRIQEEEIQKVVELCLKAKRIFIGGAGRSGFCARGFANRMMHLGFTVHSGRRFASCGIRIRQNGKFGC